MSKVKVLVRCKPNIYNVNELSGIKIGLDTIEIAVNSCNKVFSFDKVFPPDAVQVNVFDSIQSLIDCIFKGENATLFAYGATNSGKTYTIEGLKYHITNNENSLSGMNSTHKLFRANSDNKFTFTHSDQGILFRSIDYLFHEMQNKYSANKYKISISYYQLYNERIEDLLNSSSLRSDEELQIRYKPNDRFEIQNLFIMECENKAQIKELIMRGIKRKVMRSHTLNQQSSRSHTVFTVYLSLLKDPLTGLCITSELSIIDLAGSEKLKYSVPDTPFQLVEESKKINSSLLTLGKVITALTKSKAHIPYRESKLTCLLKHTLGGNSNTTMLACIDTFNGSIDEIHNTLLYACKATNISNKPLKNVDPGHVLINKLKNEIRLLKKELGIYREISIHSEGLNKQESLSNITNDLTVKSNAALPNESIAFADISKLPGQYKNTEIKLDEIIKINKMLSSKLDKTLDVIKLSQKREMILNDENIKLREQILKLECKLETEYQMSDSKISRKFSTHNVKEPLNTSRVYRLRTTDNPSYSANPIHKVNSASSLNKNISNKKQYSMLESRVKHTLRPNKEKSLSYRGSNKRAQSNNLVHSIKLLERKHNLGSNGIISGTFNDKNNSEIHSNRALSRSSSDNRRMQRELERKKLQKIHKDLQTKQIKCNTDYKRNDSHSNSINQLNLIHSASLALNTMNTYTESKENLEINSSGYLTSKQLAKIRRIAMK